MAITLTNEGVTLELPEDLMWVNEFLWSPVSQSVQRSITGALLIEISTRSGGRPIKLSGGVDYGWLRRNDLSTLYAWSAEAGRTFLLSHNGVVRTVIFDVGTNEEASNAIKQVQPVIDYSDPSSDDDYCSLELNFLEI